MSLAGSEFAELEGRVLVVGGQAVVADFVAERGEVFGEGEVLELWPERLGWIQVLDGREVEMGLAAVHLAEVETNDMNVYLSVVGAAHVRGGDVGKELGREVGAAQRRT